MTHEELVDELFDETTRADRIDRVKSVIQDLVGALMYYDRKEDESLPRGAIERMVENNEVSYEEIAAWFKKELVKND